MGSGKKAPKAPKVPAPAPVQDSDIVVDGQKVGSMHFNKSTNTWENVYNSTPEQKAAQEQYNTIRSQAADDLAHPERLNENLDAWQQTYTDQNSKPIKETAKQARIQAINNYNAKGVLGSTGSSDFINRNIDKTESEGLQGVTNEASLNRETLRNNYMADIMNRLNAGQTGSSTLYNQGLSTGQFANATGAQGNSIASQNYQDRLNGIMSRFNAQMQSYQAGKSQNSWLGPTIGAAGTIAAAMI